MIFFAKIGIFCKSIAGPLPSVVQAAKIDIFCPSDAIFSSVVQAYTQPYLFGGRIKLIICQIRHDLSATIREISTSWIKTLDGGPYFQQSCTIRCIMLNNVQFLLFKAILINIVKTSISFRHLLFPYNARNWTLHVIYNSKIGVFRRWWRSAIAVFILFYSSANTDFRKPYQRYMHISVRMGQKILLCGS